MQFRKLQLVSIEELWVGLQTATVYIELSNVTNDVNKHSGSSSYE